MNGIIFCVCSTSAIPVPPIVLKWCRKERKKMQVKKESQHNQSRWWIWSRDAAKGLLMCYLLLHQKARGKPDLKVKYLWARGMSSNKEQGDLFWTLTHQATQNGMMIKHGLLKSGIWWIDGSWNRTICCIRTAHGQIHCWKRQYGFWHRRRIKHVVFIQIILAQGEWSSAKDTGPILKDATQVSNKHFLICEG